MPFAPHEIEHKKFVVALRGYQTDEVDSFLRAVAADYRALLEAARAVPPEAHQPAHLIAEIERVMGSAREQAEQEAAEIRRAAEAEAADIRAAANAEAEAVYAEIARQAEELHRIESRVSDQLTSLDHAVREGKQALAGLNSLVR
jgi:DivIVA domain-containing protein